ncbi:MAG: hypothetical protein N2318_03745 [Meiothermus sp.]|nr:hypothetical protein [Meiothermus sp.]
MNLEFDVELGKRYTSLSQKARVLTEGWLQLNSFCPNCGALKLERQAVNKPVSDFYCEVCKEDFELKSKRNALGKTIVDGAYDSMIERLRSNDNPNLFLLIYDKNQLRVNSFIVVPKQFFVPQVIVKRKPLPASARRAGWVGCNIELHKIPNAGKIYIVKNGTVIAREKVLNAWAKMSLLFKVIPNLESRGWLLDVMRVIEHIGKQEFALEEIYSFEDQLRVLHPSNNHVRPKIRQQLQLLRDNGYLEFTHRGNYRLL